MKNTNHAAHCRCADCIDAENRVTVDRNALVRAIYSNTDASEVDARLMVDSLAASSVPSASLTTPSKEPAGAVADALRAMLAAHGAANDGREGLSVRVTRDQVEACRQARKALAAPGAAIDAREPHDEALMKLSQFAHTAAHMSESDMRNNLSSIADQLIALASRSEAPAASAPAAEVAQTSTRCSLGCSEACRAKEHGCASECPALPWQPGAAEVAAGAESSHVHLAWRGALKACGVGEADRNAISEVVMSMLAESTPQRTLASSPSSAPAESGWQPKDYPPLPTRRMRNLDDEFEDLTPMTFTADEMRAYVDADRKARAAAPQAVQAGGEGGA